MAEREERSKKGAESQIFFHLFSPFRPSLRPSGRIKSPMGSPWPQAVQRPVQASERWRVAPMAPTTVSRRYVQPQTGELQESG